LKNIAKNFFVLNLHINCKFLNIFLEGPTLYPRIIHNFQEEGMGHPHGLESKRPDQTWWGIFIQLEEHGAVIRVCAGQVMNSHLSFVNPSESWTMESQVHHTAQIKTLLKHLNPSGV